MNQTEDSIAIEDYNQAIKDSIAIEVFERTRARKAIEIDSNDSDAYFSRGQAKLNLNQKESACADFSKARELGDKDANDNSVIEYCK